MPRLILTRGLPASGKTTWAKQFITDNPGWIRINKDELRLELLNDGWSKAKEEQIILPARNERIVSALKNGISVIVDDTNLAQRHESDIFNLARPYLTSPSDFEVKDFKVSVEEAIERDSKRAGPGRVGEKVIRGMAKQSARARGIHPDTKIVKVQPCDAPPAIICDLDGTIAHHEGVRDIYDGSKCHLDSVDRPVEFVLHACVGLEDTRIIYLSGRDEKWREQTLEFLTDHMLPYQGMLYMRPTGDVRDDTIIKQELFDQHVRGKFNVRFVLDDRNKVVEFWRAIGLPCFQVADGAF